MILLVSGRTDVVAFYSTWFMKRYEEGYVDVRNPFNPNLVSRINFRNVEAINFCTKNPIPIMDKISMIKKPIFFHVTITPYKKNIEPNLPDKRLIIEAVRELSEKIGKDSLWVRYDPVFLSAEYSLEYHVKAFERMCSLLEGYVEKIIISFLDEYKNVRENRNILKYRPFTETDYKVIGKSFAASAKRHGMTVQTCFEEVNLTEYGFIKEDCLSHELAYRVTGKRYPSWKARNGGKCHCVELVDIGVYNTCPHLCKYCYANFKSSDIKKNREKHDPNSSLLIGNLKDDDIIKERIK